MKLCLQCSTHYKDEDQSCPEDGSQLVQVGKDPLLGCLLDEKYRLLCQVGKGSMGVVYKAIQESTGREMALKLLNNFMGDSSDQVKRFHREAKAVSRLNHPNIIRLYDFGVLEDGQPYIVTEFLKGRTLAQLLQTLGFLPLDQALPIFEQVCRAVGEAHRSRVMHRDLKPDNIFLLETEGNGASEKYNVRVLDFGVAKLFTETGNSSASLTVEGKVCGSPAYMSPEQCKGQEVDYRSDLYSLGVLIFETLSGKRPFSAQDLMALMLMHVNKEVPALATVQSSVKFHTELENVVHKALSKNPNERQQSAEELWEDLRAASEGRSKTITVTPPTNWIKFEAGIQLSSTPQAVASQLVDTSTSVPIHKKDASATTLTLNAVKPNRFFEALKRLKVKSIVLFAALISVSLILVKVLQEQSILNEAESLINRGRCEEGVQILERLQSGNRLPPEQFETLNNAYVQIAMAYARQKKYGPALKFLQKVSPKSKVIEKASELTRQYKAKVR